MNPAAAPANDFLARLAARAVGDEPVVRPRLPGRFEQPTDAADEEAPVLAGPIGPIAAPPPRDVPPGATTPVDARPETAPERPPAREAPNEPAEYPLQPARLAEPSQIPRPTAFAAPEPILNVAARHAMVPAAATVVPQPPLRRPPVAPAPRIVEPPARFVERITVHQGAAAPAIRSATHRPISGDVRPPQAVLTPAPARAEVLPPPAQPPPPETIVNIAIGRIEIRAPSQTAAPAPARVRSGQPAQSLDDYLRTRAGKA